ncbi:MAG: hypothetical protein JJ896_11550 [Rhodothermales bacterium]|nr:hypothetical protein [Rhodothermales bacterium]MBO6780278.1 hypothetical protein [Rhodothermales bacterium]
MTHTSMVRNSLTVLLLIFFVAAFTPSDAFAQPRLGVHVGLNTEGTDLLLGGQAQFGIDLGERSGMGQLGFEIYPFIDGAFLSRINANVLFNLIESAGAEIYGGGGLMIGLTRFDEPLPNGDETDSDIGFNILGGVVLSGADRNYRPFIELNQTVGGGTDFAIRGGVFFKLGS